MANSSGRVRSITAMSSPCMRRRREAMGEAASFRIEPQSMSVSRLPVRATTPYPVARVPGSRPRTTTVPFPRSRPCRSAAEGGKFLFIDVEIRVDVLDVVVLFERLQELHELLGLPARHLDGVLR